jgi:hypothetical protein
MWLCTNYRTEAKDLPQKQQRTNSMTALMLANSEPVMLILLIGSTIGLSRLGGGNPNGSVTGL